MPPGMIVHEMTHAYVQDQNYLGHDVNGTGNEGYSEAFADYARYKLTPEHGAKGEPGWDLTAHAHRFAAMTDGEVKASAAAMTSGSFTQEMLRTPDSIPGVATTGPGGGDTRAGGNNGGITQAVTKDAQLMGGFLTGKFRWDDLDPAVQKSVMGLANAGVDVKAVVAEVMAREPNASAEARANDVRAIVFSNYLKDHKLGYDAIRKEAIASGAVTVADNGALKYAGVNQGDAPSLDPNFLATTGGKAQETTANTKGVQGTIPNPDGTYPLWIDPRTGQALAGGLDSDGNGIPDMYDTMHQNAANQKIANATATYTTYTSGLGLDTSGNVGKLIDKAAQNGWNSARFQEQLYKTADFQQAFPGIFNDQGGLKMTPEQYQYNALQYQDAAAAAGVNLGPKEQAALFANDVSVREAGLRMQHEHTLKTNRAMFDAFNRELVAAGQQPLDKKGIFNFLSGQGNAAAVNLWENAAADYSATQSGIKIGGPAGQYTSLGRKQFEKIANLGLSEADLASGFGQLAHAFLTTVPLSHIQNSGLSKSDIRQAVFGGPKQAKIQEKMKHMLGQLQAAGQATAHTQVTPTQGGGLQAIGENKQRAGSAY
jgi:hypothetical protein